MAEDKETCITRIHNDTHIGIYTSEMKQINYLLKLKEQYPEKVIINKINEDGSVCADVPYNWFRMPKPPKKMNLSEEEREKRAKRLRKNSENC